MIAVAVAAPVIRRSGTWLKSLAELIVLMFGAAIPIGGFYLFLTDQAGSQIAAQGIAGSWHWIFNSDVTKLPFYQNGAGTDQLGWNILLILRSVVAAALAMTIVVLFSRRLTARTAAISVACMIAIVLLTGQFLPIFLTGRLVAITTVSVAAVFLFKFIRKNEFTQRDVHLLAWSILASLLLLKIFFNANLFYYGFALAMPAMLLVVPILVHWVPNLICTGDGRAKCQFVLVAIILIETTAVASLSFDLMFEKNHALPVGKHDSLVTQAAYRGPILEAAIDFMQANCDADSTILTLPEGVMLNYWLRRENPSPYINFMPPELAMFGEQSDGRDL